jgi:antitoxin YefM
MRSVSLSDAVANLPTLLADAVNTHERVEVTWNGRRAAVILSADDYDSMVEMLNILNDCELVTEIQNARIEAERGEVFTLDAVTEAMRQAGRLMVNTYSDPVDNFVYSVEREFDIPVEVLWDAWVDPVALEAWYHPKDLTCVPGSVRSDPVEGGSWAVGIDTSDFGFITYFYGRYTAVVPQYRLDHTMHDTQSAAEFEVCDESTAHHLVRIEFDHRGMRSWVKFSQFGEGMSEAEAIRAQEGMESYFDSLENFLASTSPM